MIFPSEIQRTLRFRIMKREQRERYEQGGLQGTLRFSRGKGELSLRGKLPGATPFFVRDFRAFRGYFPV